jgi:hypothetical protein
MSPHNDQPCAFKLFHLKCPYFPSSETVSNCSIFYFLARLHKSCSQGKKDLLENPLLCDRQSPLTPLCYDDKTDSARSALSSFTCTLCNKSYSRHPEYEAHISSYDHQHRKRLQDLKQLSRDPNAAERARRAEKKADAEAGLRVLDNASATAAGGGGGGGGGGSSGGGFKKGGFKSSFAAVKGPAVPTAPVRKNVLGEDEDEDDNTNNTAIADLSGGGAALPEKERTDQESDTDDEQGRDDVDGGYYDPRRPTDCFTDCAGVKDIAVT